MARNPAEKYKGTYRVRCEIDNNTNDYPRELKKTHLGALEPIGEYIHNDVYIQTKYGKIYWVDRGMYEAWVGDEFSKFSRKEKFNSLVKLFKSDIISVMDGDGEGTFVFSENILDKVVKNMGGKYRTAIDRSPFSNSNLEYANYTIPKKDLDILSEIAEKNKWKMNTYQKAYFDFAYKKLKLHKYLFKNEETKKDDLSLCRNKFWQEIRKEKLKAKEYIHKCGYWEEFLDFCRKYK